MKNGKGLRRWTEREDIARNKDTWLNGDPHEQLALREPLYSSFVKDKKFVEAPIGKGLNHWERRKT